MRAQASDGDAASSFETATASSATIARARAINAESGLPVLAIALVLARA